MPMVYVGELRELVEAGSYRRVAHPGRPGPLLEDSFDSDAPPRRPAVVHAPPDRLAVCLGRLIIAAHRTAVRARHALDRLI